MSRVLVYCLEGLNMHVWCMYNELWICIRLLWWNGFGSSLPLLVWLCCMSFFYFCDDHQFIDESRCERYSRSTWKGLVPLHSLPGLDFMFCWAFLQGYGPCTTLFFSTLLTMVKFLDFVCIRHRGVHWFLLASSGYCHE